MALTVLIANGVLSGRTGTETVTRNLAVALLRAGHRPIVYSPVHGPIVDELRALAIPVTKDVGSITIPVDVIHGHHNPTTAIAAARFPDSPALFVCNDFTQWFDLPPRLPNIRRYAGVGEITCDRLRIQGGIAAERVLLLLNAIDLERCPSGAPLPAKPRRALVVAKGSRYVDVIGEACAAHGIDLDVIGRTPADVVAQPEERSAKADLVFASGLSAMEAMACGRAVILCDERGLAGFCTPEAFHAFRPHNFGLGSLGRPVTVKTITEEILRVDSKAAAATAEIARRQLGFDAYVQRIIPVYAAMIEEHRRNPVAAVDWHTSIATHLQCWTPRTDLVVMGLADYEGLRAAFARHDGPRYPVSAGGRYGFAAADDPGWYYAGGNFSGVEKEGIWTDGDRAWFFFNIDQSLAQGFCMRLELAPFLCDTHAEQTVFVQVNGRPVAEWHFASGHEHADTKLDISADLVGEEAAIWVSLLIADPRSPAQCGLNSDIRRLGIRLHAIRFDMLA